MSYPIITPLIPAFFATSTSFVGKDNSMIGEAFGIAFGGIVGLLVFIVGGIFLTKCINRKFRAHKIKRRAKKAQKKVRADIEKARRDYEYSGTNRPGPMVGEVIDVEINGLSFPPPTHAKHDIEYENESRSQKTLQRRDCKIMTSPNDIRPSKGRNNWLWWRRMEMTPRGDIEQGTPRSRAPSPGGMPPSYADGGQNLHLHRVQARQGRDQQQGFALGEIGAQPPGPLPIQPPARMPMPMQTQMQTQIERKTLQDIEDDKSPNILVAFCGFLSSWARVEKEESRGGRGGKV